MRKAQINEIKTRLDFDFYDINKYFAVCPIGVIGKTRKADIVAWRHLGLVWVTLAFGCASRAQRMFNMHNHCATALHAQKRFLLMLDGIHDPKLKAAYETLVNYIKQQQHEITNE